MTDEEIGFDEAEALADDDVVEIDVDGERLRCVVLAVFEEGERTFAVLQAVGDGDDDLLVVRYEEDVDGGMHFAPLADDDDFDRLQATIARLLPIDAGPSED